MCVRESIQIWCVWVCVRERERETETESHLREISCFVGALRRYLILKFINICRPLHPLREGEKKIKHRFSSISLLLKPAKIFESQDGSIPYPIRKKVIFFIC